jgi:uncharacterized membrane protein
MAKRNSPGHTRQKKPSFAYAQAAREYVGSRARFWDFAVTFSIFTLFILLILEWTVELTPDQIVLFDIANMLCLVVFAVDLFKKYQEERNVGRFILKNWLALLALLPIGTMFRMARFGESLGLVRVLKLERALPLAEELAFAIPGVRLVAESKIVAEVVVQGHKLASSASSVSEFAGEVSRIFEGMLRGR